MELFFNSIPRDAAPDGLLTGGLDTGRAGRHFALGLPNAIAFATPMIAAQDFGLWARRSGIPTDIGSFIRMIALQLTLVASITTLISDRND
ncbi:hypothetical protein ACN9MF_27645 [Methylobacterium fujisawaense]|uniref:hypothetical protein n=1 Tax=Methylobacterium fujisawaense TaxID=107400 RepID=UPI003CF1E9BF